MYQAMPRLFGGYARNRILFALALRGPQRRRELSRAAAVDPQQTLEILRAFARTGAIIYQPGERKSIELDASFCAASELRSLISKIAGVPAPDLTEFVNTTAPTIDALELFGSRTRTVVLMELSDGASPRTTGSIMDATALTEQSVSAAVNYLERDGILESFVERHKRHISINADFVGANELLALLVKLRAAMSERPNESLVRRSS